ncbi:ammonium transporter AmtB-like domain-containing protein [Cokeromyces recurvatus]|uniref:ammonium transporter AmtB-like domain-containing protein n=1 Tax=Cokeromyces recurvatus TaxID=90255 RepID=UPI002220B45C|nr:ammonium transporter AmtB-like domain-containing protein [Cokeromyces recurvatus]KAI7902456.1 ammonium transporter AmtB-like domain-containing protein [Cokeromyces recurvatus]
MSLCKQFNNWSIPKDKKKLSVVRGLRACFRSQQKLCFQAFYSFSETGSVWLMIPGIGFFYSGMTREKNALSLIMCSVLSLVVVSIQWFVLGYSLTFSKTTVSSMIGNLDNAFFRNVLGEPSIGSPKIPDIVFCAYQGMFAALTPALVIGSAAERGRLLPMILFMFIWSTLVYDFIVYAAWGIHGWSGQLGSLDFAGGTPVHITSGFSSLAYTIILGKRHDRNFKPHHVSNVVLGTALLWFGWFGFNGGSALAGNARAAMACVVTHLSACTGAITWMCLDYYYRTHHKFSALGFCSGAVAGLVTITPGSGFVSPISAIVIGFLGAIFCYIAVHLKDRMCFDDSMDVFAIHGVGGYVGSLLTGIFADPSIVALDGHSSPPQIAGGWVYGHHWMQVPIQLAEATAGAAWSFTITYIVLYIMDHIPGLSLRVDHQVELDGLDITEIGELAYSQVDTLFFNGDNQRIVSKVVDRTEVSVNEGVMITDEKDIDNTNTNTTNNNSNASLSLQHTTALN